MKHLLILTLLMGHINAIAQNIAYFYFDISSTQLNNIGIHKLDSLVYYNVIRQNKRYNIIGYADNTGDEIANLELSNKRARVVFDHLKYLGIDSQNINVLIGKGAVGIKGLPNQNNRRVDIIADTSTMPPSPQPPTVDIKKLKPGEKFKLDRLYFVGGMATLLESSMPTLEYLLKLLKEHPKLIIRLEGHVHHENIRYRVPSNAFSVRNNRELESSLQKLSDDRAYSVYKYLVDNGIDEKRLHWKGFSYSKFHESPKNNRRVEVRILAK
ncbi:MAG: OmpA family protein [Flavipsychrobacter sp.]